jgi:hypothetical protein
MSYSNNLNTTNGWAIEQLEMEESGKNVLNEEQRGEFLVSNIILQFAEYDSNRMSKDIIFRRAREPSREYRGGS